ncbi:MAG TPA: transglutaminase domain-containing protein [Polyangiaceae bacterium]|nr:transglutaminase domain-containing protein [Polyangiaceae bacterium]
MKARNVLVALGLFGLAPFASSGAAAAPGATTLHEPIPIDARDDIAMGVVLEGDIPAAIQTKSGVFSAPDPNRVPTPSELQAAKDASGDVGSTFTPDRDTRRPDVLRYVDPFTPSTAPFKRLVAFDAVDAKFALYTFHSHLSPLPVVHGVAMPGEDVFYGDITVDIGPDKHARIPSVGPGSRVLHAHLGVGARELPVMLVHDGADNWFIDSGETASARLVLELAIPRSTFGGELADPDWSALPSPNVPDEVASAAKDVMAHIGIGRHLRPAENIKKMVSYFRAFVDSDRPLEASKDVYTDLAMSQKGVCRHRAYAFAITSLALGIPTRMVINEAHAWVEVYDGVMWRRIDLGGAGRMLSEEAQTAEPYAAPSDAFPWPANATRGEDLTEKARNINGNGGGGNGNGGTGGGTGPTSTNGAPTPSTTAGNNGNGAAADPNDARPTSDVTIDLGENDASRGTAVHVKGRVMADGEACANVSVNVFLRDPKSKREARIGTVATDEHGNFGAPITLPTNVPVGDYDVVARTDGAARCGRGSSK